MKKIALIVFLIVLNAGLHNEAFAQHRLMYSDYTSSAFQSETVSAISPADSVAKPKVHSPKKAATMSALCPGLGQIYNRKYWKLPIIYLSMGGLAYGFGFNQKEFSYYRNVLRTRYDDDSTTIDPLPQYSDASIVAFKNDYQRYRDLCVIGFSAVYLLQVIDAAVDGHLYTFDVGPDLSLNWQPQFIPAQGTPVYGIGFQLNYR